MSKLIPYYSAVGYLTESVDKVVKCIYTLYMPLNKIDTSSKHQSNEDKCAEMVVECVCLNLRKASRTITQTYDQALKPSGLRSTQLPVLSILISTGPMTVNNLADELLMDRTSLSRLLRPLVSRGLIEMTPGEDRRTRELSVSFKGKDVVASAIPLWEKAQKEVLERLGNDQWRTLKNNLGVAAMLNN